MIYCLYDFTFSRYFTYGNIQMRPVLGNKGDKYRDVVLQDEKFKITQPAKGNYKDELRKTNKILNSQFIQLLSEG